MQSTEKDSRPKGYEYRHIICAEMAVNSVVNQHAMFYWELVGTQHVVSKESHLEPGGFIDAVFGNSDVIYSVRTEERYATVDIKRSTSIPDIEKIRSIENEYFALAGQLEQIGCSVVDEYSTPPARKKIGLFDLFGFGFDFRAPWTR